MVKFTHYLVTRFNVRLHGNGPEFIRPDAKGTNWEEERMPLFTRYCAPSIAGQTSKDFTWLIYTDTETPDALLQKITSAIPALVNYLIVPVEGFDAMLVDLKTKCAQASTPYIITSRLDNDDAVSKNYIETIQAHFEPRHNVVINLLGGVNYNTRKNIFSHHRYSLRNSFCSLVEERREGSMITVIGFNHLHPPPASTTKNIPIPFAFWMNLHDHNAAIRQNTGIPFINKNVIRYYAIDPQYLEISISNTIAYTLRWFPRALKRKIAFKMKKLLGKLEPDSPIKSNVF